MSQVTITNLPIISTISANTQNTIFAAVDIPSDTTGRITAHTLAQGLYSNEVLNVGSNPFTLPNTIAQFALGGDSYIQTNLVNTNDGGSADIVVTASVGSGGTDSAYFIDMGFVNKNYQPGSEFNNIGTAVSPLDGYLYAQGLNSSTVGGNLIVGTTSTSGQLKFIVGGSNSSNVVAKMTPTGLVMNTQSYIVFGDGTTQTTAAASNAYTQAAFALANSASANTISQSAVNLTQNTNITAAFTQANAAFNTANSALQNTTNITITNNLFGGNATFSGNISANYVLANNFGNPAGVSIQAANSYWNFNANGNVYFSPGQQYLPNVWATSIYTTNTIINNGIVTTANISSSYITSNVIIATGGSVRNPNMPSDGGVIYVGASNTKTHSTTMFVNDSISTVNVVGFLNVSNTITSNALILGDSGLYQYTTSNNATVTQLTSKSTAVTCNGRTGQITTNSSTLNKGVAVQFTVNNNQIISAKDIVIVNIASGASVGYDISVNNVQPGSFQINIHNSDSTGSGSNASDTLVINFAIIRVN